MIGISGQAFIIFSSHHLTVIFGIGLTVLLMGLYSKQQKLKYFPSRKFEKGFAVSLLGTEWLYYVWLGSTGKWSVSHSLPLELCSISLYAAIILLWTNNRRLYPFVFFAGIGGAIQAIITPDLELSFPHFRFFHFFYTHTGIILTALYFTWIKGYRPSFPKVIQTMLILNGFAIIIYVINLIVHGNYMFLRNKPKAGSLLDYLGPYPLYLLSLQGVAFMTFIVLWLLFNKKEDTKI